MHPYLFNFSASYQGGGLKRLTAYSEWFHRHGGATFVIHQNCASLRQTYPGNQYYVVNPTTLERLFADGAVIREIVKKSGPFELYFSYGIPIYRKIAVVNWFHLSNLLPLGYKGIRLGLILGAKMRLLGHRLKKYKKNCDIISAESDHALSLCRHIRSGAADITYTISQNGVEELLLKSKSAKKPALNQLTVVGTQPYKNLEKSYAIFSLLRTRIPGLQMYIIGEISKIAQKLSQDRDIHLQGSIPQKQVYEQLGRSLYYLTNSAIENSSNASLEGLLLAQSSILSDIPSNKELLSGCAYQEIDCAGERMLFAQQKQIRNRIKVKKWHAIVKDMISLVQAKIRP